MDFKSRTTLIGSRLEPLAQRMEKASAEEILAWALGTFSPDIALACSFSAEDMVLVDMLSKIKPGVKVFYLDTGLLFQETYELRDQVQQRYPVELIQVLPALTVEEQAEEWGEALWQRDPDQCCLLRKVLPLKKMLSRLSAWITGIRREQAPTRARAKVVEWDAKFHLVKVNPLARYTNQDIWQYIHKHGVPYNPLHDQGYPSIGCWPCTRPVKPGEDPRAGRWSGFNKTECGLHGGDA